MFGSPTTILLVHRESPDTKPLEGGMCLIGGIALCVELLFQQKTDFNLYDRSKRNVYSSKRKQYI